MSFNDFKLPLVGNTEAKIMKSEEIKALLARQVMKPVRFYDSIATIQEFGVDEVIEIGPGKVLSGFLKKLTKAYQLIMWKIKRALRPFLMLKTR